MSAIAGTDTLPHGWETGRRSTAGNGRVESAGMPANGSSLVSRGRGANARQARILLTHLDDEAWSAVCPDLREAVFQLATGRRQGAAACDAHGCNVAVLSDSLGDLLVDHVCQELYAVGCGVLSRL